MAKTKSKCKDTNIIENQQYFMKKNEEKANIYK